MSKQIDAECVTHSGAWLTVIDFFVRYRVVGANERNVIRAVNKKYTLYAWSTARHIHREKSGLIYQYVHIPSNEFFLRNANYFLVQLFIATGQAHTLSNKTKRKFSIAADQEHSPSDG